MTLKDFSKAFQKARQITQITQMRFSKLVENLIEPTFLLNLFLSVGVVETCGRNLKSNLQRMIFKETKSIRPKLNDYLNAKQNKINFINF